MPSLFEFFRKRAEKKRLQQDALRTGREAGQSLFHAVQAELRLRLPGVSARLLDVFRERLMTVDDDPNYTPEAIAKAEWRAFENQVAEFPDRIRDAVESNLREWLDVAEELGAGEMIAAHIDKRIVEAAAALREQGLLLFAERIADLRRRQRN